MQTVTNNNRIKSVNAPTTEVVRHNYWISKRRHSFESTRVRLL